MLAMGSVRTLIMESAAAHKIQFDINAFLTSVILADLNLSGKYIRRFTSCSVIIEILMS